ncbi:MAG TPA: DUF2911 domain-containing protein, partial [Gemmatimonadales bacterium]|nr:DUF2911 domain-containing protein [Gemmatimonadales bacterium]
ASRTAPHATEAPMLLPLLLALTPGHRLPAPAPQADPLACITMNTRGLPLATRQSPLDSIDFTVGGAKVRLCYGRPSARGRTMIGGAAVPFGKLWRTGANEPTMIHTTGPLVIAGVAVPAGTYSIYSVPSATDWQIIVNRSITQWGHESQYTEKVKAQEVGRGTVTSGALASPVETLTFRSDPGKDGAVNLLLEWEKTRVTIPIAPGKS